MSPDAARSLPCRRPDLNLLVTLDVLLAEGNVARAARRLRLSPSAMSRALARLRETTGDPLLVRAGRGLVPTPRALELRERVRQLVQDAEAVLRPAEEPRPRAARAHVHAAHERRLRRELRARHPRARRRARRPACGCASCRSPTRTARRCATGRVDLETGVVREATGPELRTQALFRDRFVGVVRTGHPLRQAQGDARALRRRPARRRLAARPRPRADRRGARRRSGWSARSSRSSAASRPRSRSPAPPTWSRRVPERHTGNLRAGMHSFALPVRRTGVHGVDALAPAARCRPGASLAARLRARRLRSAALIPQPPPASSTWGLLCPSAATPGARREWWRGP